MGNGRLRVAVLSERAGTNAGGPEVYERGLLTALLEAAAEAGDVEVIPVFAYSNVLRSIPPDLRSSCRTLKPEGKLGTVFATGRMIRRLGADVFHACFVLPPFLGRIPIVSTVHDLGFVRYPEQYPRLLCWRLKASLRRTVGRSDVIVVESESAGEDLVELAGAQADRLRKIYNGIDEKFLVRVDAEEDRRIIRAHGVKEPYILYAGKLEPRKNVSALVEAYDRLRSSGRFSGQLVLIGANRTFGWRPSQERIDRSPYRADIIQTGHLADGSVRAFYARAAVLAFVSLFEGFGFPVIEAMALDVPVVCSNSTSLPEISGGAALLVDPHDPEAIAQAISRAVADEILRKKLISRGRDWVQQFTWRETARQYLNIYRSLA